MSEFGTLFGTALKAAAAAALTTNAPVQDSGLNQKPAIVQTPISAVQPYVGGDIHLNDIQEFPQASTFQKYLMKGSDIDNNSAQIYKDFTPTINSYYTPNQRVRITTYGYYGYGDIYNDFLRGNYDIGYKNKEQMFCHTLTSVIVEDFHFGREVSKKSIYDILNTIINGYGTFDYSTISGSESGIGRVKYIDEFGGPLQSSIKKTYLMSLLSKGNEAVEAMRFYTKKEGITLYEDCYRSIGGDSSYNPLQLVSFKEDFLLNSIAEVREYFSKIKASQDLESSRNQARLARDNKIKAEQEAKMREEQNRVQDEYNRQRALEALRIERENKEAAIAEQAASEEMLRKQKEINRQKALESLGR